MTLTLRNVTLLALPILAILASCTLAPDHCLTMSDCGDGLTCVEGLCQGPPAEALSANADASNVGSDATSSTATPAVDASSVDAADASADGAADASDDALTDAASDS